jgi:hypothetical protein
MTIVHAQREVLLQATTERLERAVDRAVSSANWPKVPNRRRPVG